MQTLHDKHSTESLTQKEQAVISEARAMMEDMLGEPLADDQPMDNLNDIFNIGMERLHEAAQAEQEMQQQKKARRKKKSTAANVKPKPPNRRQTPLYARYFVNSPVHCTQIAKTTLTNAHARHT